MTSSGPRIYTLTQFTPSTAYDMASDGRLGLWDYDSQTFIECYPLAESSSGSFSTETRLDSLRWQASQVAANDDDSPYEWTEAGAADMAASLSPLWRAQREAMQI